MVGSEDEGRGTRPDIGMLQVEKGKGLEQVADDTGATTSAGGDQEPFGGALAAGGLQRLGNSPVKLARLSLSAAMSKRQAISRYTCSLVLASVPRERALASSSSINLGYVGGGAVPLVQKLH